MTRRVIALVGVLVVLVSGSVWVAAQSGTSQLQGVWAVQEVSFANPVDNPPNNPTGFIMFSGQHYSMMFLRNGDRPDMGPLEAATASADELRAVWGPLTANAGIFEVSGSTLTTRPTIAKMTFPMAPGFFTSVRSHWTATPSC